MKGQQWEYKIIPFGIKPGLNKPFQKYIANILGDIGNVFAFIDDIIIYNKGKKIILKQFQKYLKNCINKFRTINFFQKQIEVLGYEVNIEGVLPRTKYLDNKIFDKEITTKRDI